MKPRKTHVGSISGFALPAVIVISVLVMTVLAMSLWAVTIDSCVYREYHQYRQRMMDVESALTVYRYDSGMFSDSDSVVINVPSGSEVSIVRRDWGLYECVSALDKEGYSITRLYGVESESHETAAFWLSDMNRALTLDAGAVIEGLAYIPPNGINYSGDDQSMQMIRKEFIRISQPELPPLDSGCQYRIRRILSAISAGNGEIAKYGDRQFRRSFQRGPELRYVAASDSVFRVDGMVMLYGDKICISGESVMHDAIICAKKVIVKDGFRGCIQIFCTDSVFLEPGVKLEWPSGIHVASESGYPHVYIGSGCRIDGYVVVTGAVTDHDLEFPGYQQRQGAVLNGLLYADCSCEIGGNISGAAYVRDCFHGEDGMKYPGTIASVMIVRDERLAFPILMTGDYDRKAIKNLK